MGFAASFSLSTFALLWIANSNIIIRIENQPAFKRAIFNILYTPARSKIKLSLKAVTGKCMKRKARLKAQRNKIDNINV